MSALIRKIAVLAFTFLFVQATIANAETILYCQTELAPGIYKENGRWRTGDFKLDRYTIKFNSDFSSVQGLAYKDNAIKCESPFEPDYPEIIQCSGFFRSLTFNKETQNFVFFQGSVGYVLNVPDPDTKVFDTETISAGTCEKF